MPTPRDLEDFCDAWFRDWTGGNVDKLLGWYAEECFYSDPTRPKGVTGREELRRYLLKWLPMNARMVWTRETLYPTDGGFCVTWSARIPVGDETLVERGMDVVLLDDAGQIVRNEVYFDMSAWRHALRRS